MEIKKRAIERRKRMIAHRAANFEDAERWDLLFWQNQSAEQRLSALVSIREDIMAIEQGRKTKARINKFGD
jgi:hypothetical protein